MRTASPLPWSGSAWDTWCDPQHRPHTLATFADAALAAADGAARVDDMHLEHWPLIQRLADTTEALTLVRNMLGPDLDVESSRILVHRGPAAMPVHQDGAGPGLLLDPRHTVTSVYVLAHDGDTAFATVVPTSLADGYLRHGTLDCSEFGSLPRLLPEPGRRGRSTDVDLPPGHALHCDPRTLRQYGSSAFWVALILRWVTPLGVVRRPAGAPPIRRVSGEFVHWHEPAALERARSKRFGPEHDAGADECLVALGTGPGTPPPADSGNLIGTPHRSVGGFRTVESGRLRGVGAIAALSSGCRGWVCRVAASPTPTF
ncbi:hypothetical protein ACFZBU_39530 [Embleya sp. NPDC008237]|uniref:hypothetical protein n=1 Tax=Embleya sp. NPDC008237 TaxID=3363978 RepID=UPI0036E4B4B6